MLKIEPHLVSICINDLPSHFLKGLEIIPDTKEVKGKELPVIDLSNVGLAESEMMRMRGILQNYFQCSVSKRIFPDTGMIGVRIHENCKLFVDELKKRGCKLVNRKQDE